MKKTKIIFAGLCSVCFGLILALNAQAGGMTGDFQDKLFYSKHDNNYTNYDVYMADSNGKNSVKILSGFSDYAGWQVVKGNSLVYHRAENGVDRIYRYDLTSQQATLIKEVEGSIVQLAWYDLNKYAYIVETKLANNQRSWKLYLVSQGKEKMMIRWHGSRSGRGVSIEDGGLLDFSPNGQKIIHIATASPRNVLDFKVYIFDQRHLIHKISQATHPSWLSNSEIVYRGYKNGYLYKYNLATKKSIRLTQLPQDSYSPKALPGTHKMAFWADTTNPRVYVYDFQKKQLTRSKTKLAYPEWISKNKLLVYNTTKHCPLRECEFSPVYTKGVGILKLPDRIFKPLIFKNRGYFTQY